MSAQPDEGPGSAGSPTASPTPPAQPPQNIQQPQQERPELIQPLERPRLANGDPALGTRGKQIKLELNVFQAKLDFQDQPGLVWMQYRVDMNQIKRDGTHKDLPKGLWRPVWSAFADLQLWGTASVAFDGRSLCYSNQNLDLNHLQGVPVQVPQEGNFQVTISSPICLDPVQLARYYMDPTRGVFIGDVNSCLAAVNTIFSHSSAQQYPANKTTFFVQNPQALGLDSSHAVARLRGGVECWRGFFCAVRAAHNGLIVNIDTTTGAFVKSGSVAEFLKDFGRGGNCIDPRTKILINRMLRSCKVEIPPSQPDRPARICKIHNKGGLTSNSASREMFETRDGRMMSIETYFRETHNYVVRERDLPCIEIKPGMIIPAELVTILPGNRYLKKLDSDQQNNASAFQILRPVERLKAIMAISQSLLSQNQLLPKFGILVNPSARKILGRVLAPPAINYGVSGTQNVQQGAWRMDRNRTKLLQGSKVNSFAILLPRSQDPGRVAEALLPLFQGCGNLGLEFNLSRPPPCIPYHPGSMDRALDEGRRVAEESYGSPADVIFCIFDVPNTPDYHSFKAHGVRRGVATQTLQARNVNPKKSNDFQFVINMAIKLNGKLGGINHNLVKNTTSGDRQAGWLETHETVVFGVDLTHADGRPSMATLVASVNNDATSFMETTTAQRLVEPELEGGRAKRSELVEFLDEMLSELLVKHTVKNGKLPPKHLIVYRDGGSESEWSALMTSEIGKFEIGVENFKKQLAKANPDPACLEELMKWSPQITYLLAIKRHHIRAFGSQENGSIEGRSGNVPAGTCFDSGAGDARAFDFYLASHTGILGTTKPTRYVVLRDDAKMSPDDLQSLTNALCHTYQRCNRAVSIPAPVYYADIIAAKVRAGMPDIFEDSTTATSSSLSTPESRRNDLVRVQNYLADIQAGRERFASGDRFCQWWL
ncbi:Piwi-domain-containing protein [Meredithblackwellia eburnea MCA 4105]